MHFSQLIKSEKFEMYDYGAFLNLYYYYSIWPPEYDLSQSDVEVALFYGMKDWISTPEVCFSKIVIFKEKWKKKVKHYNSCTLQDVSLLNDALPNSKIFPINYENFTHIDFLWANDVKQFVYDDVLLYLNNITIA